MSLDRRIRESEDPVERIVWKLRVGELAEDQVKLAAKLGDPRAKVIFPRLRKVKWAFRLSRAEAIERACRGDRRIMALWSCDVIEHALDHLCKEIDDWRLHDAIGMLRNWIAGREPREILDEAVDLAARTNDEFSSMLRYGPSDAAAAVISAVEVVEDLESSTPEFDAADAAMFSFSAVSNSGEDRKAAQAEAEWQMLHLARYALGEAGQDSGVESNPKLYHRGRSRIQGGMDHGRMKFGDYGPGFYFSEAPESSAVYGPWLHEADVRIDKPLDLELASAEEVRRVMRALGVRSDYLDPRGEPPLVQVMGLLQGNCSPAQVASALKRLGYDGIRVRSRGYWAALDPGQIEILSARLAD